MVFFPITAQNNPSFQPYGPKIEVVLTNGKSFEITTDPKDSPKTVKQILKLTSAGFYNRQRIHRVEDWVIQWGAPASKTQPLMTKGTDGKLDVNPAVGDGGSGVMLPFEMCDVDFTRGVVGIASDGLQMGGDSQLFVLKSNRFYLWHSYAVVGKVTKGMDTIDSIRFGDRIKKMTVIGK